MNKLNSSINKIRSDFKKLREQGYWFAAKRFGWGFTPITWQGWVSILLYILLVVKLAAKAAAFEEVPHSTIDTIIYFILPFAFLTALLIFVCYKKGQKPHWNWGVQFDEKDEE